MGHLVYQTVSEQLNAGRKCVLARIIRRAGSTPREVGCMCIITEDHQIMGTVGGGLLEYKVQQKASELLDSGQSFVYKFTLSNDDLAKNGMICGGSADVFMEVLSPSDTGTMDLFNTIHSELQKDRPLTLVTRIEDGLLPDASGLRMLIMPDGSVSGNLPGFDPKKAAVSTESPFQLIKNPDNNGFFFAEHLSLSPRVFLFGAGHVSTCVAPLAKSVGFDITVIDDRPEFANKERFPDADDILIFPFKDAFKRLDISSNAYILIITRGHLHDKSVLEMALNTPAGYIGMIGSIKKRNIIYNDLLKQGYSKEQLESVCSPVGIEINARTPEEIAVSIVGELIQKRAPAKPETPLLL